VTVARSGRGDNAIICQEFQRAVDGGLGHAGLPDARIDLSRGKVTVVVQGFQNGKSLRGHAETALAQGLGMEGKAGHRRFLIAKIINNDYMQ